LSGIALMFWADQNWKSDDDSRAPLKKHWPSMKTEQVKTGHLVALAYCSSVALLLTLNPFRFAQTPNLDTWGWRYSPTDFGQNILLFLPLGIVLFPVVRHCFRRSILCALIVALAFGSCLSMAIEFTQLSIEVRGGNGFDVLANGLGALLGAWMRGTLDRYHKFSAPRSLSFSLAWMIAPLCWVSAMRSAVDPLAACGIFPSAIAAMVVLRSCIEEQRLRTILSGIWLALALAPLLQIHPAIGAAIFIAAPITVWNIEPSIDDKLLVGACLLVGLLFASGLNGVVLLQNFELAWNIPFHLRWIELILILALIFISNHWRVGRESEIR